jgi:hypothetical protein
MRLLLIGLPLAPARVRLFSLLALISEPIVRIQQNSLLTYEIRYCTVTVWC